MVLNNQEVEVERKKNAGSKYRYAMPQSRPGSPVPLEAGKYKEATEGLTCF